MILFVASWHQSVGQESAQLSAEGLIISELEGGERASYGPMTSKGPLFVIQLPPRFPCSPPSHSGCQE
jgi:hypothetical protein